MVFGDALIRLGATQVPSPLSRFSSQTRISAGTPPQALAWSSSRQASLSHLTVAAEPGSPEVRWWKMRWMLHFLPQPTGELEDLVRSIDDLPKAERTLPWRLALRGVPRGPSEPPAAHAVELS
mmetsp:Transcript_2995/g.8987  ORF Transcript_2995/g.8987 Transcript_2995/m.8987 type:complete len:123 (+) Transcript_2995:468-836(+)